MRAIVTCEGCGHRQVVARTIQAPETFHIICHSCERTLLVAVTAADVRAARTRATTAPPRRLAPSGPAV